MQQLEHAHPLAGSFAATWMTRLRCVHGSLRHLSQEADGQPHRVVRQHVRAAEPRTEGLWRGSRGAVLLNLFLGAGDGLQARPEPQVHRPTGHRDSVDAPDPGCKLDWLVPAAAVHRHGPTLECSFCRQGATTILLRCAACSVTAWAAVGWYLQLLPTAPSARRSLCTNGLAHSAAHDTNARFVRTIRLGICGECSLPYQTIQCGVLVRACTRGNRIAHRPRHRHGAKAPLHRADVRTLMEVLASVRSIVGPAHPASLPVGCPG